MRKRDLDTVVADPATAPASPLTVSLVYFARLKEALGKERELIELPAAVRTVGALREHLRARGAPWDSELAAGKPVCVAVNQDMAAAGTPIKSGDEIAFFPPVTGG